MNSSIKLSLYILTHETRDTSNLDIYAKKVSKIRCKVVTRRGVFELLVYTEVGTKIQVKD